jgi:hypothetical protein
VIGEPEICNSPVRSGPHERFRRERTVGCRTMGMEINRTEMVRTVHVARPSVQK